MIYYTISPKQGGLFMHESGEMYLETIYILSRKGTQLRSIDIAEYMGYTKPSISRAVGLLKKSGHILVDKDGFITLTENGRVIAERMYERHTTLTDILLRLGVDSETASEDACRMEHDISDKTFQALKSHFDKIQNP